MTSRAHGTGERCGRPSMPGWTVCAEHRRVCVLSDAASKRPFDVRVPSYHYADADEWIPGTDVKPLSPPYATAAKRDEARRRVAEWEAHRATYNRFKRVKQEKPEEER